MGECVRCKEFMGFAVDGGCPHCGASIYKPAPPEPAASLTDKAEAGEAGLQEAPDACVSGSTQSLGRTPITSPADALLTYGEHRPHCACAPSMGGPRRDDQICVCGFNDALKVFRCSPDWSLQPEQAVQDAEAFCEEWHENNAPGYDVEMIQARDAQWRARIAKLEAFAVEMQKIGCECDYSVGVDGCISCEATIALETK